MKEQLDLYQFSKGRLPGILDLRWPHPSKLKPMLIKTAFITKKQDLFSDHIKENVLIAKKKGFVWRQHTQKK